MELTLTCPPPTSTRHGPLHDESGATLVEFALILPLFMMLVLGMFTGGLAYDKESTLTYASREGARYASTLPKAQFATSTEWLNAVTSTLRDRASGVLDDPSATICVAIVSGTASPPAVVGGYSTNGGAACYRDGTTDGSERVQVAVRRSAEIDALVFRRTVTLASEATSRYES